MITENLSTLKIHRLTQAQYDRELASGNIDGDALYLTPDEEIDFPVDSVNGKIGDVVLTAEDIGLIDWFGAGIPIPSNADLDTYTTIGKYYVSNTSTAGTITNAPTTSDNYVLFVFSRTSKSILTQLAISLGGGIFVRGTDSTKIWRSWRSFVPSTRTVNGKPLSTNIELNASDVGAIPNVPVTTSDNGKFLRVVNGAWAATTVPNAEGASF